MSEDSRFIEIPEINPKTGKSPKLFICRACGAAVGNRRVHLGWHSRMSEEAARGHPYATDWPPID